VKASATGERGVFKKPDGSMWIRWKATDERGRKRIYRQKMPDGTSLQKAADLVAEKRRDVAKHKVFPETLRPKCVTFTEVAKDFLEYSRREKRSYAHDKARMETLLRLWRDQPIKEMKPGPIEADLADCSEEEEWAPATYNRYRALASGVFHLAIRNAKLLTVNPVAATRHRTENNTRVRYLSDEEETALFDYINSNCPERGPEVLVAIHSGMRRSEQYEIADCKGSGLKWRHINFDRDIITLPRSKHGESRHIPMNSVLRATLLDLKNVSTSEHVFAPGPPSKWFQKLCKEAKIADFNWHALRHTFASRLVMKGVDLRTVQEHMGHKSIVTTMRYAHLAPAHGAEAVERLVTRGTGPVSGTSSSTSTQAVPQKQRSNVM
jgi:integrase